MIFKHFKWSNIKMTLADICVVNESNVKNVKYAEKLVVMLRTFIMDVD